VLSAIVLLLALFLGGLHHIASTSPFFSPTEIARVHAAALAAFPINDSSNVSQLNRTFTHLVHLLLAHPVYGKHIHADPANLFWVNNLAGGFKTSMLLLHGSLTEYIMIWGAQLPTTGHSGRNWAEFHDWMLSGKGDWWAEGGLDIHSKKGGDYKYTVPFSGGIVRLNDNTFMLEYCRGVIPALLPFGLGDTVLSSLDPVTLWYSLSGYGKMVWKELWQFGKI